MEIKAEQLQEEFSSLLTKVKGNTQLIIKDIAPFEDFSDGDLIFVNDPKKLKDIREKKPSAIVLPEEEFESWEPQDGQVVFASPNVGVAHALIKQKYKEVDIFQTEFERIHPTAVIHESVKIPESTTVGPFVVIGKDAVIGENCVFMAHVVIERRAKIGDGTIIHPLSVVGHDCIVGKRNHILSHAVIGSEGFGFAKDENNHYHRIPQTGIVELGDDVTIGANNTIDRAAYKVTKIGRGTKFDNICHTAHNVQMGEDCIVTTGFACAGSTKIGDRVIFSGGSMLIDHVNVCDDTIFVHKAGIINDVKKPGVYAGSPIQPVEQYMKNFIASKKLSEMAKQVKEMAKEIQALKEKIES